MMLPYVSEPVPAKCFLIALPLWFLALVFSIYPTTALIRGPLRRYRRRRKGLCLKYGYSLTGNPYLFVPERRWRQALLGHSNVKTTLTWYSKVNKADAERRIREAQTKAG